MRYFFSHKFIYLIFFANIFLNGQVTFNVSVNKNSVAVNESFTVTYSLKRDASDYNIGNIVYPDFSSFQLFGNSSSTQLTSQYSVISKSFSFQAIKKGVYEIEPATVKVDGKMLQTESIEIKVTDQIKQKGKNANIQGGSNSNVYIPQRGENLNNDTSKNTKLLVTATNLSPYIGEQVYVSVRVLTKDYNILSRIRESKVNRFKNFTVVDFLSKNNTVEKENYKGEEYFSHVIYGKVITAQKVGELALDTFQIEIPYNTGQRIRDFFGRITDRYIWVKLESNKLKFNVNNLPSENKPKSFNGAVGDYNFNVFVDKTKDLKTGESIHLDLEVSGQGDFKMVSIPKVNLTDELEIYEPEVTEKVQLTKGGYKGKISQSNVIIPQYKGIYNIDPIEFSFFNPKLKKYEVKKFPKIQLNVIRGDEAPENSLVDNDLSENDNFKQNDLKSEELSLMPLKRSFNIDKPFLSSFLIWLLIILTLLVIPFYFGICWVLKKYKAKESLIKVNSSKDYLLKARVFLENEESEAFYNSIEKSIYQSLNEKYDLDKKGYTITDIKVILDENNVSDDLKVRMYDILNTCDFQKYSPVNSSSSMEATYLNTESLIKELKK